MRVLTSKGSTPCAVAPGWHVITQHTAVLAKVTCFASTLGPYTVASILVLCGPGSCLMPCKVVYHCTHAHTMCSIRFP